jgi:hypothetical protein
MYPTFYNAIDIPPPEYMFRGIIVKSALSRLDARRVRAVKVAER